MQRPMLLNIIATTCPDDKETEFNRWYNEVHIPMLLEYNGIKCVSRYRLQGDADGQAKFIALYEFESPEALAGLQTSDVLKAAIADLNETWGDTVQLLSNKVYDLIQSWEQ